MKSSSKAHTARDGPILPTAHRPLIQHPILPRRVRLDHHNRLNYTLNRPKRRDLNALRQLINVRKSNFGLIDFVFRLRGAADSTTRVDVVV
jgi:hypothetical protein